MAATYTDLYWISAQVVFQRRVWAALSTTAISIDGEDPATAGHALRQAYATKIPTLAINIQGASLAVLVVPSVAAVANAADVAAPNYGVTDAQIQTAVNAIFSMLAGA